MYYMYHRWFSSTDLCVNGWTTLLKLGSGRANVRFFSMYVFIVINLSKMFVRSIPLYYITILDYYTWALINLNRSSRKKEEETYMYRIECIKRSTHVFKLHLLLLAQHKIIISFTYPCIISFGLQFSDFLITFQQCFSGLR